MDERERSGRSTWGAWAQAAALGLLLGGCGGGAQGANTPEVDVGQGDAQGVRTLSSDHGASDGYASPRKSAPLPAEFSALGKECPSAPNEAAQAGVQVICGKDNRVAALWKFLPGMTAPPMPEPVIQRGTPGPAPGMPGMGSAARVHLDSEHLWVASACMMCRVPQESLWIGDLSLVTDEQIGQVQMQMGIPMKPALRDEKSWRAALAKGARGE